MPRCVVIFSIRTDVQGVSCFDPRRLRSKVAPVFLKHAVYYGKCSNNVLFGIAASKEVCLILNY